MLRKILIIEDDDINRLLLKSILSKKYDVYEATNGEEGLLQVHHRYKFLSAIILDLSMPIMDGFEFLKHIQNNVLLSQIPILVVTGSTAEEDCVRAIELGANDFIIKPYNPALILNSLRNTINLRENATIVNAIQKDRLTGLLNRDAFFEKSKNMIIDSPKNSLVLACFDIDNFKYINNQYGSIEGNRILKLIGNVVKKDMEEVDGLAARISGDNFATLYPKTILDTGESFLTRIKKDSLIVLGENKPISISIGRYEIKDIDLPVSSMYDRAFLAKQSIKGKYNVHLAYFDEDMLDSLNSEQWIVSEMSLAITNHEFEVWFQPQINHSTGLLIGAEALVRWNSHEKGLISPGAFIPIFEKNGFIYELDKYVWEKTCQYIQNRKINKQKYFPISVNISRFDFFQPDFVNFLLNLIDKYALKVSDLRLEITESAFSENGDQIIRLVKELKDYGFFIEIDDFGSGYSSLNTLKDVPANVIKLDMKFMESKEKSPRGGNIVESIVRMAKWLDMIVIAEGVETVDQADFLKSIGCEYIQGYFYSKPLKESDFNQYIEQYTIERKHSTIEAVDNFDNNLLWLPDSMDSIIFNSFIGGVCIIEFRDSKFELLRMNDKFIHVFGANDVSRASLLKLKWNDYLDEENTKRIDDAIKSSLSLREEVNLETTFQNLPFSEKKVVLSVNLRIIASVGNRHLLYCTCENVTRQKEIEHKEVELVFQLRAILDNVNGGVAVCSFTHDDPSILQLEYSNDQFYKTRGYTKKSFTAYVKNFSGCVLPEDYNAARNALFNDLKIGKNITIFYRIIRKDRAIRWIQNNLSMTLFPYRKDPVIISVTNDITIEKESQERIRISEEQFRIAATMGERMIARYDFKTKLFYNENLILFGEQIGKQIKNAPQYFFDHDLIAEESRDDFADIFQLIQKGVVHLEKNLLIRNKVGVFTWFRCEVTNFLDDEKKPCEAIFVFQDISEQREKEAVYRKWQQSLQEKSDSSYTLFRCNLSKNASYDSRVGSLLQINFPNGNYSFDMRTRQYANEYVYFEDQQTYLESFQSEVLLANYYRGKKVDILEYREILPNGGYRWLRRTAELVEYPDSKDIEIYIMYEDIDSKKNQEQFTQKLVEIDELTQVLNRRAIITRLEERLKQRDPNKISALFMLDIDGFKNVNDSFGHIVGDQVLVSLSKDVLSVVRADDLFGRLGGDEFLVYIHQVPNREAVEDFAKKIGQVVRHNLAQDITTSVSIGISIYPQDGDNFETLYQKADVALYMVKNKGKDSYEFYSEDMKFFQQDIQYKVNSLNLDIPFDEIRHRILVVDDNPITCEQIAGILKKQYDVDICMSGKEALSKLHHYRTDYSLVLLDLIMPDIDGYEVLRLMQESNDIQEIPVIVVSGTGDENAGIQCIRFGAIDFITKPIDSNLLKHRVELAFAKLDNESLRSNNTYLFNQTLMMKDYQIILGEKKISFIEYNTKLKTYVYDKNLSLLLHGTFDSRPILSILKEDQIASNATIENIKCLYQDFCKNQMDNSKPILVSLLHSSGSYHNFLLRITKVVHNSTVVHLFTIMEKNDNETTK